ncbi:MAG: M36 family metallopeptidase [Myxococcaceae bacterium]|nr:M36 family metallopeptidase [Myxococcaceae bacterium]
MSVFLAPPMSGTVTRLGATMNRRFTLVAALCASAAVAQVPRRDAFLSRGEARDVPELIELSPMARAAVGAGFISSTERRLGVPTFFWVGQPPAGARTPKDMGLSAEHVARRTLFTHAELYRADRARWAEARLSHLHALDDQGAVIATFQQDVGGVRVFRDEVKVAMTKDFVPVAISGYLTPQTKPLGAFNLSAPTAALTAITALSGRGVESTELSALSYRDGYQLYRLRGEPTPVRTRQVYFPLPEGLEPGFYVEVELNEGDTDSRYFSYVVSARSGEVLYEKNLTADAEYRVWADPSGLGLPYDGPSGNSPTPHPAGTPNGFQPAFVPQELVSRDFGPISTMDPWLPANATRTEGNNTFAYADIVRPNGFGMGDLAATMTDAGVFDRLYDVTQNPDVNPEQRMAATTQLFYNVNFFHDWYYDKGFDERAGNAQVSNYGRGGRENDPINSEAQDNSGRSNANMSTPSDGARPRMQMYIFDGTSSERLTLNGTTITSNGASFGPQQYNVTGELVLVDDGDPSGMNGSIHDACQANFTTPVAGKVALIDRGNCTFVQKVQLAQMNGAVGVIIADIQTSSRPPDLVGTPMPNTTIPAMSVTRAGGMTLRGAIAGSTPPMVTLTRSATTDRDGTLDNAIVAHEWGHYISNRLIGDGNGLSSQQSVGMGEGWSDFHALLMMVKADDLNVPSNANWTGTWPVGGYTTAATSSNGHYFGVRRLPYSVDFAKNALTFQHIQRGVPLPAGPPTAFGRDGSLNNQVHQTGEVWASMLWECYVALLRDTQRLTFDQAQDRMMRYLVGGYKLTPVMPTFVEARDAILAAAVARDPDDFALLWAAFARRGLGMQATAPDRDAPDNRPAVESFVVGNAIAITDVTIDDSSTSCDMDGTLDTDEVGLLKVSVKNVGVGMLSTSTVNVSTATTGLSFPQGATVPVPALAPFGSATVSLPVTLKGARGFVAGQIRVEVNDSSLAVPGPVVRDFRARLNSNLKPDSSAVDDVEAPMSRWTVANNPNGNTGSDWRIAQSSATVHWWFGPNPASPADTYLISPQLEVGSGPFVMTFKHRYEFEQDMTTFYDGAAVELSVDGRTWTDIGMLAMPGYGGAIPQQSSNPLRGRRAFVGKSANYPTFNPETIDLGTQYAGQMVRVRFRIGSDDAAANKGWEVDDIAFTGLRNLPFTSVAADPNTCSGNRAPTLTVGPNQVVREGDAVTLVATAVDPDGDPASVLFVQREGPQVEVLDGVFNAPLVDADSVIAFDVVATDRSIESMPQRMTVTVLDSASRPLVTAPMRVEVQEGEIARIQAAARAAADRIVTFRWTQVDGPAAKLAGADTDALALEAPFVEADATLTLEVVANDGQFDSDPVRVEVLVREAGLEAPPVVEPKKPGCGCTSGLEGVSLLGFAVLGQALRRRLKR